MPHLLVVLDDADHPETSHAHHVRLTVTQLSEYSTPSLGSIGFKLEVDGGGVDQEDFRQVRNPAIYLRSTGKMRIIHADEARISFATKPEDFTGSNGAARGRFVRDGTYLSPVYTLDIPAVLRSSQWTGIVPAGYGSSADPFRVKVIGYDGPDGTGAPRTMQLGPRGFLHTYDLSGLGTIRSFRYSVEMDASSSGDPLVKDTPVFNGIWFVFRRKGRGPAWTAWGER